VSRELLAQQTASLALAAAEERRLTVRVARLEEGADVAEAEVLAERSARHAQLQAALRQVRQSRGESAEAKADVRRLLRQLEAAAAAAAEAGEEVKKSKAASEVKIETEHAMP
jgi:hypothetical protein